MIRDVLFHPRVGIQRTIYEAVCPECAWVRWSARKWKAERMLAKHIKIHDVVPSELEAQFAASLVVLA